MKRTSDRHPMSFEQLFSIRDEILKFIESEDPREGLNREIARIVTPFDDGKTALSLKRDIIELICSIEMIKIRFLRGDVRAKDIHREVRLRLHQFHLRHRGFNYLDHPIINAYF
jgi:hypothetical protein